MWKSGLHHSHALSLARDHILCQKKISKRLPNPIILPHAWHPKIKHVKVRDGNQRESYCQTRLSQVTQGSMQQREDPELPTTASCCWALHDPTRCAHEVYPCGVLPKLLANPKHLLDKFCSCLKQELTFWRWIPAMRYSLNPAGLQGVRQDGEISPPTHVQVSSLVRAKLFSNRFTMEKAGRFSWFFLHQYSNW